MTELLQNPHEAALRVELAKLRGEWIATYGKYGGLALLDQPKLAYDGPADFILRHGIPFTPRPFPAGFPIGAQLACFGNAIVLATYAADHGARYIEGYAMSPSGEAILHAWNAGPEGSLVDSTWQNNGTAYLGVEFSVERADDSTWNGDATVLDDWQRGWPVLLAPWEGERYDLAWPASERLNLIREAREHGAVERERIYEHLALQVAAGRVTRRNA